MMKTINATQEQINDALKTVLTEPVAIASEQKDIAILLSSARYRELLGFEKNVLNAENKNVKNFEIVAEKLDALLRDANINEDELVTEFKQLRTNNEQ